MLSKLIKKEYKAQKWSIGELSEASKIHRRTLARFFDGETVTMSLSSVDKVCKALGIEHFVRVP